MSRPITSTRPLSQVTLSSFTNGSGFLDEIDSLI